MIMELGSRLIKSENRFYAQYLLPRVIGNITNEQIATLYETYPGADPGFQVRGGAHLKKLRRAEGDTKIFGVFRVKNHDFTPKNNIFSNFRGEARAGCRP